MIKLLLITKSKVRKKILKTIVRARLSGQNQTLQLKLDSAARIRLCSQN
jgi:hypothetical protein